MSSKLVLSAKHLVSQTQRFARHLRGDPVSQRGVKLSAVGKAMQAGVGKMKDASYSIAATFKHKRWWVKGRPLYWRYRYYGSSPARWEDRKRPTGRLKENLKVKLTSKSTGIDIRVDVYEKFNRQRDRWDRKNIWYARYVEFGTGPGKRGKHPHLHKPTQAYPFFFKGVTQGQKSAVNEVDSRIEQFFSSYVFR